MDIVLNIALIIIAIALLPLAIKVSLEVIILFLSLLCLLCEYWFQIILFAMGYFFYQGRDILSYPIIMMLWGALYYIGVQYAKDNENKV